MEDVFEKARQRITPGLIKSYFDASGSYDQGGEFFTLNPLRQDNKVGSFHISLETGVWVDHATGEGGSFIDLVAGAKNISPKEAAELIAGEQAKKKHPPRTKTEKVIEPIAIIDKTPENVKQIQTMVQGEFWLKKFGVATAMWKWINSKNEWVFCTVKFEVRDDTGLLINKNVIPFYKTGSGKWKTAGSAKAIGSPEPYGIDKLGKNDKILIVEGEKCASCEVPGYSLVTWWGGTQRVDKTNWDALKKFKDITIWPDYDTQRDKHGDLLKEKVQPYAEQLLMKTVEYEKVKRELEDSLKKFHELGKHFKEEKHKSFQTLVKERTAEVKEKMRKGKKLSTEDILAFQAGKD